MRCVPLQGIEMCVPVAAWCEDEALLHGVFSFKHRPAPTSQERCNQYVDILQRFVSAAKTWMHFDIFAWNPSTRPGRPEGGECQAARAVYAYLCERYG